MAEPIDFLHYLDRLNGLMKDAERRTRSYTETCCCGASVAVGSDVPARERGRLTNHFIARHQHCTQPREADVTLDAITGSDEDGRQG